MDRSHPRAQAVLCAALLLAAALSLSCNQGATDAGGGSDTSSPEISLSAISSPVGVVEGGTTNIPVTLNRMNNYSGTVTLGVTGLPTGVTGAFNPATLSGSALASTLTLTAAPLPPRSPETPIQVTATASDQFVGTPFFLIVSQPRVSVSRVGTGLRHRALPDSMLQAGDVQVTGLGATPQGNSTTFRFVFLMQHSPAGQTVTFGPALNTPTVASLGSAPYLRLHAQLASQSAYNAAAQAQFQQTSNSASVVVTAAYSGGTPANWTLDMPDLTSAGYNAAWGLKSGATVNWQVTSVGGNFLPFVGGPVTDGAQTVGAGTTSPSSGVTFSRHAPTIAGALPRRP